MSDAQVVGAGPKDRRRSGVFGAVLGLAAAGVAIAVAAEHALVRRDRRRARRVPDRFADEPFGRLPYDEALRVPTPGGPDLYVEVVDPVDGIELAAEFADALAAGGRAPDPTVVFVHGFCLDMGAFHFQRKELTRRGDWRAVYYDQPGHGRSGRGTAREYDLAGLGGALKAVLDETTPYGPVVLVGHSMGGMTVMALAERYPDYVAERVAAAVLIATSAGRPAGSPSGLPALISRVGRPLFPLVGGAGRVTGPMVDRARQAASDLARLLTRRYGFGGPDPSPALVSYVEQMNSRTTTETVAGYLRTLHSHHRYPALAALRGLPVLLICGDRDPITPLAHAQEMKAHLPDAELVVVPDSGHVVQLEHAGEVNQALLALLERLG
jgi:pimeloyl-ACP methyl ester carboxylesterase